MLPSVGLWLANKGFVHLCWPPRELQLQPLEDRFRDRTYDEHDWTPDPGRVEHVFAAANCPCDIASDALGAGDERRFWVYLARRHSRGHETGFDREHVDAGGLQSVAQALQIGR